MWWRKVRNHTYWLPGAGLHPDGNSYYVPDVALRKNEEGLSLYSVADESDAKQVAHYYALTQMGYDNLDYLLIPDGPWTILGLSPRHVPATGLPRFLSTRHFEVNGLTPSLETLLAAAILADANRTAHRLTRKTVLSVAQSYLSRDPGLRRLLHEEWEAKLQD